MSDLGKLYPRSVSHPATDRLGRDGNGCQTNRMLVHRSTRCRTGNWANEHAARPGAVQKTSGSISRVYRNEPARAGSCPSVQAAGFTEIAYEGVWDSFNRGQIERKGKSAIILRSLAAMMPSFPKTKAERSPALCGDMAGGQLTSRLTSSF